jgi:hypothetical protein
MNDNEDNWSTFGPGAPVACEGTSYVFVEGADIGRPGTVLATTRNLEGDIASRWVGADEPAGGDNVMNLLNAGEGQAVSSDGSARQASDADLVAEGGELTGRHLRETGGVTQGPSSTGLLTCGGGAPNFEDVTKGGGGGTNPGTPGKEYVGKSRWGNLNQLKSASGVSLPNDAFAFRFDGMATVTKTGSQKVSFKADDPAWVWFDLNGDNKVDAGETSGGGKHNCCRWYDKNMDFPEAGEYRVAFAFEEYGGGQNLEVKVANQQLDLVGFANGGAANNKNHAKGSHWNEWHGKPARD